MKVLSVVGARPQFVKAAAVSRALNGHEEVLVHTGQHYDFELSEVFFEDLDLAEPDYHLGVGSGTHGRQTAKMMTDLEEVLEEERPDVVLVYGDTNSTLAAALVAAKSPPALAHVEAGLRSGDRTMPEEINRVLTDHCSDVLYAPSEDAAQNLEREGIAGDVSVPGDVMYDTLLRVRERLGNGNPSLDVLESVDADADGGVDAEIDGGVDAELDRSGAVDAELDRSDRYVLATIHREKNTTRPERLEAIVDGLNRLPHPVVLPAHPRTVDALSEYGLWERATDGIEIVDPLGYPAFLRLIVGAECVVTDSGGVQKEAFYLDTPCLTVRDTTEWTETVEAGWNVLVGADADRLVDAYREFGTLPPKPDLYGNGNAAGRIVADLERRFE